MAVTLWYGGDYVLYLNTSTPSSNDNASALTKHKTKRKKFSLSLCPLFLLHSWVVDRWYSPCCINKEVVPHIYSQ